LFEKDLLLDVLGSTATKREAKAYLSRFSIPKIGSQTAKPALLNAKYVGVNLGSLYMPVRAVDENPVFSTSPDKSRFTHEAVQSLHIALVKIRAPQAVDESTLLGVGQTLSQLTQLGLSCVVVLDLEDGEQRNTAERVKLLAEQADRIVAVIEGYGRQGARQLDSVVGVFPIDQQALPSVKIQGPIRITDRELLLAPLYRGVIPVIVPIGFNPSTQMVVPVVADEVILALTREFAGLQTNSQVKELIGNVPGAILKPQKQISLDRVIVLDPLGGIPSGGKAHGSHVFINLEQEFKSIMADLISAGTGPFQSVKPGSHQKNASSPFISRDCFPKSLDVNSVATKSQVSELESVAETHLRHSSAGYHVRNLHLIKHALALLPPSASAFLTTPNAVANSQSRPPLTSQGPRVRTRRQRNPLIHNLLTDKPVFSSSLPSNRLQESAAQASSSANALSPATFFKRGMPVSIVPDPLHKEWTAPSASSPTISMDDPRIDLSRLVHLIDDSFNRKLDVPHYLDRIRDRVAGVIIAGEYEGGAILTWETPPGVPADDFSRMVPYLDKFAVLKRSQGAGGVADIVFKAMVRECFPNGVCWRSRKNNPVNKWYFERAKGTWKIPGANWTMFWTTEGVDVGDKVFSDYQRVCRAVEPSWADDKSVVD